MSAAQAGGRWCAQSTHGTGIRNAARPGIIGRGPAAKCRHPTPSRFSGKGPSPVGSKQSASSALCWAPICRSLAPAARRVGAGQNDTAEREQLPCRSGRCGQEGQRRAGRRHSRPCLRRKCAGWAARRTRRGRRLQRSAVLRQRRAVARAQDRKPQQRAGCLCRRRHDLCVKPSLPIPCTAPACTAAASSSVHTTCCYWSRLPRLLPPSATMHWQPGMSMHCILAVTTPDRAVPHTEPASTSCERRYRFVA